jgi:hypothetical protein
MAKKNTFKHVNVIGFVSGNVNSKDADLIKGKSDNLSHTDAPIPDPVENNSELKPNPDATKGDENADMTQNEPIVKIKSDE